VAKRAASGSELLRLKSLNVLHAVNNRTAKLEINWPLPEPTPALKRPGRNTPTMGYFVLVQMAQRSAAMRCAAGLITGAVVDHANRVEVMPPWPYACAVSLVLSR